MEPIEFFDKAMSLDDSDKVILFDMFLSIDKYNEFYDDVYNDFIALIESFIDKKGR